MGNNQSNEDKYNKTGKFDRGTYARLSGAAAKEPSSRSDYFKEHNLKKWKIVVNTPDYFVAVNGKEVAISYAPTRLDQSNRALDDLVVDAAIALHAETRTSRYNEAVYISSWARRAYPDSHIVQTGTSLGGRIADQVAIDQDFDSIVFNPGTTLPTAASVIGDFLNPPDSRYRHENYYVTTDVLSLASSSLSHREQYPYLPQEGLEAHSIVNFF